MSRTTQARGRRDEGRNLRHRLVRIDLACERSEGACSSVIDLAVRTAGLGLIAFDFLGEAQVASLPIR